MNKQTNKNEGAACCFAVAIALLTLIMVLLCGCRTRYITQTETEYKEIPIMVHDTLTQKVFSHDTTIVRDSVLIRQQGDTIYYTKYKDIYRTKWMHDTTLQVVERPITITQTKEKVIPKVEYRLLWWQEALAWLGGFALAIGIAWAAIKIRK